MKDKAQEIKMSTYFNYIWEKLIDELESLGYVEEEVEYE
jgi:hypothetical protein